MTLHAPSGSLWHRWDLHFHTPASFDYQCKSVTNAQIVDKLIAEGVRVVAITDHHTMDVRRIQELQKLGGDKLTVLPGIELRSDQGGKPIHYICIFPESCKLDDVWVTVCGRLGLTPTDIAAKGGDEKVYVPLEDGATVTRELGGIVTIHAGEKSNSIDEIKNREQFQQRIKFDITSRFVDVLEVGQIKDIDVHLHTIFPRTGLNKPLFLCSDNHDIANYAVRAPLWLRADPTFRGLLMVIREPRDRVFMGPRPPDLVRVEQNPTKYLSGISFNRESTAPAADVWFSGTVQFNPGLVAIVGNKGSGKSALADTLGLLGATKNAESFSFLNAGRFRHPTSGRAGHFTATARWESGETVSRRLSDMPKTEEVERLKYLPQNHVEEVCNELVGVGEEGFERELKAVIFSHVPEAQRLGHSTLDDLLRFQSDEKQKRVDSLLKQLREASRERSIREAQADPVAHRELEEKIKRRELELEAHDNAKPVAVPDPSKGEGGVQPDEELLKELAEADAKRKALNDRAANAASAIRVSQRRQAVAKRLLEKLDNFQKEFGVFKASLEEDAKELGLTADSLVTLSVTKGEPERIRDSAISESDKAVKELDATEPPGLRAQLANIDAVIAEIQSKLGAPNRAYQAYLTILAEWTERRKQLAGSSDDAESLAGLQASKAALAALPALIKQSRERQKRLALEIHAEKVGQAEVLRTLYGPVQTFINSHPLAKDKLKLEFRAELSNVDFVDRLMALLALNRRGSFMGVDEGRKRATDLTQATDWESAASVEKFLKDVDDALHINLRDEPPREVQLKDQLLKGKRPEEVFDLMYGLEYVRPRYILRWEGKELAMLSPGERGTLLLVFYLLIDKSDVPLVIDQPEGNLDNHTVAKVLVDCIKEARRRRQVFLVTHNPNLAVVCDADQVVYASMDKQNGNAITYISGALENPQISQFVTDVLEGTRWAFGVRGAKYEVGE